MLRENWGSINGIVDVSILVIAHFDNPAKIHALKFLRSVLKLDIRALIPTTAFIGAYHILTNYLKVPRKLARDALIFTLNTKSRAFYEDILITTAIDAIDYAAVYNIESWDGYLVSLARKFGTKIIYSIDKRIQKVEEILVVNPIPEDSMKEYHKFIKNLMKKKTIEK